MSIMFLISLNSGKAECAPVQTNMPATKVVPSMVTCFALYTLLLSVIHDNNACVSVGNVSTQTDCTFDVYNGGLRNLGDIKKERHHILVSLGQSFQNIFVVMSVMNYFLENFMLTLQSHCPQIHQRTKALYEIRVMLYVTTLRS